MPECQPTATSYLAAIRRPGCPACHQVRMLLSRLEPGPSGADRASFECPKCDRVETMLVSQHRRSTISDWLSGDRWLLF